MHHEYGKAKANTDATLALLSGGLIRRVRPPSWPGRLGAASAGLVPVNEIEPCY